MKEKIHPKNKKLVHAWDRVFVCNMDDCGCNNIYYGHGKNNVGSLTRYEIGPRTFYFCDKALAKIEDDFPNVKISYDPTYDKCLPYGPSCSN